MDIFLGSFTSQFYATILLQLEWKGRSYISSKRQTVLNFSCLSITRQPKGCVKAYFSCFHSYNYTSFSKMGMISQAPYYSWEYETVFQNC